MALLNYAYTITPAVPKATVTVDSASATQMTLKITDLESLDVQLQPPNPPPTFVLKVLNSVVLPIAALLSKAIPGKIHDSVVGKTMSQTFDPPIGYTITVAGVTVRVQATTLAIANLNGFVAGTGTASVVPPAAGGQS